MKQNSALASQRLRLLIFLCKDDQETDYSQKIKTERISLRICTQQKYGFDGVAVSIMQRRGNERTDHNASHTFQEQESSHAEEFALSGKRSPLWIKKSRLQKADNAPHHCRFQNASI